MWYLHVTIGGEYRLYVTFGVTEVNFRYMFFAIFRYVLFEVNLSYKLLVVDKFRPWRFINATCYVWYLTLPVPGYFEIWKAQSRFCLLSEKSACAINLKISGNIYDHKISNFAKF